MNDIAASTQRAHETVDRATEAAEAGVRSATHAAHRAVDRVAANATRLVASGRRLTNDVNAHVSAHPLRTLVIALAAGYVIGRLIR